MVLDAEGGGVHAGDEGGAGGGADGGIGEGVEVADTFAGELVEVWGLGEGVVVAAEVGAIIFAGDPEDIGVGGTGGCADEGERECEGGEEGVLHRLGGGLGVGLAQPEQSGGGECGDDGDGGEEDLGDGAWGGAGDTGGFLSGDDRAVEFIVVVIGEDIGGEGEAAGGEATEVDGGMDVAESGSGDGGIFDFGFGEFLDGGEDAFSGEASWEFGVFEGGGCVAGVFPGDAATRGVGGGESGAFQTGEALGGRDDNIIEVEDEFTGVGCPGGLAGAGVGVGGPGDEDFGFEGPSDPPDGLDGLDTGLGGEVGRAEGAEVREPVFVGCGGFLWTDREEEELGGFFVWGGGSMVGEGALAEGAGGQGGLGDGGEGGIAGLAAQDRGGGWVGGGELTGLGWEVADGAADIAGFDEAIAAGAGGGGRGHNLFQARVMSQARVVREASVTARTRVSFVWFVGRVPWTWPVWPFARMSRGGFWGWWRRVRT